MRQVTRNIYTYSELSAKAKQAALDWFHRGMMNGRNEYADRVTESFTNGLEERGLSTLKCHWSLSYCQGDGVAFYGRIDPTEFARVDSGFAALYATVTAVDPDVILNIESSATSSHYNRYKTMAVSVDHDSDKDAVDLACHGLHEYVTAYLRDLSKQFERDGYEEIEFMDSEEYFIDACDANKWEFYRNGKPAMGDKD